VTLADAAMPEGNSGLSGMVFTATLSTPVHYPVTVDFTTTDGTAVGGVDYVSTSGTLTVAPGDTTATLAVPIVGDVLVGRDETFTLDVTGGSNGTVARSQATGTIQNDDLGTPQFAIDNVTHAEGDAGTTPFVFTVTLTPPSDSDLAVGYTTRDGSARAPGDYRAKTGTLTFLQGEAAKTITVPVLGDWLREASEDFFVRLSGGRRLIRLGGGRGLILNDD
jgi:chitinase